MSDRLNRKEKFIKVLAQFLVENQAGKSIALELESRRKPMLPWAHEWAALRNATPLFGYPSVAEAEEALRDFLL